MGNVELAGSKKTSSVRLVKSISSGDLVLELSEEPKNWMKGDKILLATSTMAINESEELIISNIADKKITLTKAVKYYHYGS